MLAIAAAGLAVSDGSDTSGVCAARPYQATPVRLFGTAALLRCSERRSSKVCARVDGLGQRRGGTWV